MTLVDDISQSIFVAIRKTCPLLHCDTNGIVPRGDGRDFRAGSTASLLVLLRQPLRQRMIDGAVFSFYAQAVSMMTVGGRTCG